MKAMPVALPVALLFLVPGAALGADAALLKCRAVADVAARVACYDAIPVGAAKPAAALAPAPARSEENFGLEAVKQRQSEPASVQSTIVGEFDGWGPGSRIQLANGQVWRIIDGSEAVLPRRSDVRVTIERNLFGTIFLRVDGSNNSAKVRRVQ